MMEKKMETTIWGLGFRVWGLGSKQAGGHGGLYRDPYTGYEGGCWEFRL